MKFEEFDHDVKKDVPYQRWEAGVLRCKSLNQWVSKLSSMFNDDAVTNVNATTDVMEAIVEQEPDTFHP